MATKLRECPFCGSTNVSLRESGIMGFNQHTKSMEVVMFVRCADCSTSSGYSNRDKAIAAWNKRTGKRV